LADDELVRVIIAARKIGGPYGGIVELLALTAQRREEVARASSDELDIGQRIWTLPKGRTKNGKPHIVHLSNEAIVVLNRANKTGTLVFPFDGAPFQDFSRAKRELDDLSGVKDWRLHDLRRTCVSGMARLGIPPHVATKFSTTKPGRFLALPPYTSATTFFQSAKTRLNSGGHMSAKF